jgi:hypothetical protein
MKFFTGLTALVLLEAWDVAANGVISLPLWLERKKTIQ